MNLVSSKKSVVVAMSGGVDSSVTAALLLEQGYNVTGVTMDIREPSDTGPDSERAGCCSLDAVEDARRVAGILGIPFYVFNFKSQFKEKVIDYFIAEYLQGRTPNPCIACNRYIKFQALLEKALGLGAEYIATGHYARLGYSSKFRRYTVCRAADRRKDQTYVLYALTQPQIARIMMPLGDYTKDDVRKMAAGMGLPVADKAESQEICFVLDDDYRGFMQERKSGIKPGSFLNLKGDIIGTHKGIPFYTIGQRKGLGLSAGERLYVVKIDPEKNTITLGPGEAVFDSDLTAADVNMILYESLQGPLEVEAQVRYNGRPSPALISPLDGGRLRVQFKTPQRSITPGQAVVFYQGEYLAGGATITAPSKDEVHK